MSIWKVQIPTRYSVETLERIDKEVRRYPFSNRSSLIRAIVEKMLRLMDAGMVQLIEQDFQQIQSVQGVLDFSARGAEEGAGSLAESMGPERPRVLVISRRTACQPLAALGVQGWASQITPFLARLRRDYVNRGIA